MIDLSYECGRQGRRGVWLDWQEEAQAEVAVGKEHFKETALIGLF